MNAAASLMLRVSAIRGRSLAGRGGTIFTAIEVDARGARTDAAAHYVVKAPRRLLHVAVERGQLWRVSGAAYPNTITVNGFRLTEATIAPDAMELLRPSGEHIVVMLSEGAAFAGIGAVKARRLWDRFGDELYALLDRGDLARLGEVLPAPMAAALAVAWRSQGDTITLQWLQARGFPVDIGKKVLAFFGAGAAERIEEDPYRLLSFAASWKEVDAFAREVFHVARDDPRRLAGGVEEALYAAFDAGHTCLDRASLERRLRDVLTGLDAVSVRAALDAGALRGSFIEVNGRAHAPGPYLMETTVAEAIAARLPRRERLLAGPELAALLDACRDELRLVAGDPEFEFNERQLDALRLANDNACCIVTGGAGTGKTTVLRALFRICAAAGYTVYPMALSGRAAKRIGEATGCKAQTIAGFLNSFAPETAPELAVVVIDEASMADLPSAYRVLRHMPPAWRLVLTGDPHQLQPVGPGLLLHELARGGAVPLVELEQVKRHGGAIAAAAAAIRAGVWPALMRDTGADIAFVPCAPELLDDTVLRLYDQDRAASQILCATRNGTAGGVRRINALCQRRFNANGEELMLWNDEYEQHQGTGLRVGDPVICLKNDWDIDLQNGSLGVVLAVRSHGRGDDPARSLGLIRWDDGLTRELSRELLWNLEAAYAVTIHKSQGSGFERVIVPVAPCRLLDRTLLYTAVTRAERQVILVGDLDAARRAVLAPRRSDGRQVALGALLRERLNGL